MFIIIEVKYLACVSEGKQRNWNFQAIAANNPGHCFELADGLAMWLVDASTAA